MARKCTIPQCKTNYLSKKNASSKKIPVFRFPKDKKEIEKWKKSLPYKDMTVTNNSVICELHWPSSYPKKKIHGKFRPLNPPTVWPGVPKSLIPTPVSTSRTTQRTSFDVRTTQPDQLTEFKIKDCVDFAEISQRVLKGYSFTTPTTAFKSDTSIIIQSTTFNNGIPNFVLKVHQDLTFESFQFGAKTFIPSLTKNRITKVRSWSAIEEIIRHLDSASVNNKLQVIQQHLEAMSGDVGEKLYCPSIIIRAFEYFAISRSLYKKLRNDYQLPSISTLTRITSKVSKISDSSFTEQVLQTTEEKQKICVLLHDEVYVKKMLLYHGGTVFGKAQNNPSMLAETILAIMIICLHGGPKFISNIIPVSKLNSTFLYEQVNSTQTSIQRTGATVKAIICDGNRTNQAFFNKYKTTPDQPWISEHGTYLLYDFVHLLKNIRNLWLTEKTGQLTYVYEGISRTANWQFLRDIYKLESPVLLKMSSLTKAAVDPKPIERQRVQTCLQVFCDKTANALLHHPKIEKTQELLDTVQFIKLVSKWWKILNVKQKGLDVINKEPLQAVVTNIDDDRLTFIESFGLMCLQMAGRQGKRIKQLSTDTAKAVNTTCKGIVELTKDLLNNYDYEYVCLGRFTTDPLEKEFGKLRQGSGATYFINVQQVTEKIQIRKASLLLSLSAFNEDTDGATSGHYCKSCTYSMDEHISEVFDDLPKLEDSISDDTKSNLVYIAGYVERKRQSTSSGLEDTGMYYQEYGNYTEALNRGGLTIPTDSVCQWAFFCYILFNFVDDYVCQVSLLHLFEKVSEFYDFKVSTKECRILANIFIKNYCKKQTPASQKEADQKLLKLRK